MRRDLELGVVHEPLLCDSVSAATPSPDRRIQKCSPLSSSGRHAIRLGMRLVRGLATADAARIVASRADEPFTSVEDMWRRSGVPVASLVEMAEADAFLPAFSLERPDALWAIKALRCAPLPLFTAAADREDHPREAFGLGDKLAQQRSLIQVLQIEERRMVTENAVLLKRILEAETDG